MSLFGNMGAVDKKWNIEEMFPEAEFSDELLDLIDEQYERTYERTTPVQPRPQVVTKDVGDGFKVLRVDRTRTTRAYPPVWETWKHVDGREKQIPVVLEYEEQVVAPSGWTKIRATETRELPEAARTKRETGRRRSEEARQRLTEHLAVARSRVPSGREQAIGQKVSSIVRSMNAWSRNEPGQLDPVEVEVMLAEGGFAEGFLRAMQERVLRTSKGGEK